jgi:hypothetical protein
MTARHGLVPPDFDPEVQVKRFGSDRPGSFFDEPDIRPFIEDERNSVKAFLFPAGGFLVVDALRLDEDSLGGLVTWLRADRERECGQQQRGYPAEKSANRALARYCEVAHGLQVSLLFALALVHYFT